MSTTRKLLEEDARSIPTLIQAKRSAADALRFRDQIRDLPNWKTVDLLPRLETTRDPLMLWALHLELDKREIPPCLRIPSHQLGPQGDYIDLSADLLWLKKKYPNHRAVFRGWRHTLNAASGSRDWHEHIYRQFLFTYPRGMAHLASKGLGLTDKQRTALLSVPTKRMVKERAGLEGGRFVLLFDTLLQYALDHPDKARTRFPRDIAERRARIYRTYLLAAKSPTLAAEYWHRLTGECLSRQGLMAQVALVDRHLLATN